MSSEASYKREWAAYHECGHAVAYWHLGLPFEYVTLNKPPRVQPLAGGTVLTVAEKWLTQSCGCIADYQHRNLIIRDNQIGVILRGGADRFELQDKASLKVVVRPPRARMVGPGQDLAELAAIADTESWPLEFCVEVWRSCELYVSGLQPAINAVARVLLERNHLYSSDVSLIAESAMTGHPQPVIPEWARRRQ